MPLPRRWVVKRSFAWAARCRRPAKDYERLPDTFAGLHFVAFVGLMLHRLVSVVAQSPYQALGQRQLGRLSPLDIQKMHADLADSGLAPRSVQPRTGA